MERYCQSFLLTSLHGSEGGCIWYPSRQTVPSCTAQFLEAKRRRLLHLFFCGILGGTFVASYFFDKIVNKYWFCGINNFASESGSLMVKMSFSDFFLLRSQSNFDVNNLENLLEEVICHSTHELRRPNNNDLSVQ